VGVIRYWPKHTTQEHTTDNTAAISQMHFTRLHQCLEYTGNIGWRLVRLVNNQHMSMFHSTDEWRILVDNYTFMDTGLQRQRLNCCISNTTNNSHLYLIPGTCSWLTSSVIPVSNVTAGNYNKSQQVSLSSWSRVVFHVEALSTELCLGPLLLHRWLPYQNIPGHT